MFVFVNDLRFRLQSGKAIIAPRSHKFPALTELGALHLEDFAWSCGCIMTYRKAGQDKK
jgi:hypothetical protein